MSANDKVAAAATEKSEKVKKINVSNTRLAGSTALAGITEAIGSKVNDVTRSHNHRFSRKGVELVKILQLVGLQDASTDELIGRLLETKTLAAAHPDKAENWIAVGKSKRLEHDPSRREGVFSVVIKDIEVDSAKADELQNLGLKYKPRYEIFEGFIDVEIALAALAGTGASVRVRVGRQTPKDGGRYVELLQEGKEVEGARAVLFGLPGGDEAKSKGSEPHAPGPMKRPGHGNVMGQRRVSPLSQTPPSSDNSNGDG